MANTKEMNMYHEGLTKTTIMNYEAITKVTMKNYAGIALYTKSLTNNFYISTVTGRDFTLQLF